jgi:hypothetical protein
MSQADERAKVFDGAEPLIADDRTELERLRRENSALRSAAHRPRRHIRWRSVLAVVLLVLGCGLVPVSLVAVWTHDEVSDTDQFVETVGPLIADPSVQQALTNRVTTTVFEYVDVQGLANEAIDALAAQGLRPELAQRMHGLTPTLASAVNGLVRDKVGALVASPQFASAWDQAVRVAHQDMVTVLSGNSQTIVVKGDTVYLDLAPFIDVAKQRLSAEGLTIVDSIPDVHPTIALAPADQLVRAQTAYSMLDSLATVLPWITLLLLAVGVAAALLVLAVGLLVARGLLVGAVPPAGAPAAAAGFDMVVRFLRDSGRALLVLALVVALGGFLAGSSDTAVGIRRWFAGLLHKIRGGPSATGPVATWVRPHMRGLRIGAIALAVLIFVFLERPTGAAILLIATGLLVLLAAIEFLGRPDGPDVAPGSS